MEERLITYLRRTNKIKGGAFLDPKSGYQRVLCIEADFDRLREQYTCLHISPLFHHPSFLRRVYVFFGKRRDN